MTTWFATSILAGTAHQEMRESSPGADATSSPATGWTVGTTSATGTPRASLDAQTMVTGATFSGTTQPDATPVTTAGAGDCLRTVIPYKGSFATGTWTLTFAGISALGTGGAGRIVYRLLRGKEENGSGATELTAGQTSPGAATTLGTSQWTSSVATASITGFSVFNEYIFCQMAWQIDTAGAMATQDVTMRVGATATTLVSPAFTQQPDIVAGPKPYFFY